MATAYKTGTFGQFGSGKYGDLGAMVAAILLDNESRSVVLDTDQTHGHLREPLVKVISAFRSMGLQYEMPKSRELLQSNVMIACSCHPFLTPHPIPCALFKIT